MKIETGMIVWLRWPLQPHREPVRVKVVCKRSVWGETRWQVEHLVDQYISNADFSTMFGAHPSWLTPDSPLIQLAMQAE